MAGFMIKKMHVLDVSQVDSISLLNLTTTLHIICLQRVKRWVPLC